MYEIRNIEQLKQWITHAFEEITSAMLRQIFQATKERWVLFRYPQVGHLKCTKGGPWHDSTFD